MKTVGILEEDFTQYKKPSLFIATPYCDFKCERECGKSICQNSELARSKVVEIDDDELIKRYLDNKITKAIVFGGMDPLYMSFNELKDLIMKIRFTYKCDDDIVIYTGYTYEEVEDKIFTLSRISNIIVKFGRFIPDQPSHFDEVLGVELASPNQYAVKIS